MLDAIFQFTDFEAFHDAELDSQILIDHRKLSQQIKPPPAAASQLMQKRQSSKPCDTTEESGKAYQNVSLSGRKGDPTSSSSTVKKAESSSHYSKLKAKTSQQPQKAQGSLIVQSDESPSVQKMSLKLGQVNAQ